MSNTSILYFNLIKYIKSSNNLLIILYIKNLVNSMMASDKSLARGELASDSMARRPRTRIGPPEPQSREEGTSRGAHQGPVHVLDHTYRIVRKLKAIVRVEKGGGPFP
jgi:hypothetical protein